MRHATAARAHARLAHDAHHRLARVPATRPPPALREHRRPQHRRGPRRLAHARAPRAAARRAALERARERPRLPPRPADAAAPGRGAVGREFVAHANRHSKARWLCAFAPASGVLRCVGAPLDGAPCAHGALVDLRDGGAGTGGEWGRAEREVGAALERLRIWTTSGRCMRRVPPVGRAAMPAAPRSWDDGLDGAALCHELFGVCASAAHGPACVRAFGAARPRDRRGLVVLQFVDHAYCHRS